MKSVSLGFCVPDDLETTSENLAMMKQILLSALAQARDDQVEDFLQLKKVYPNLIDALLTES